MSAQPFRVKQECATPSQPCASSNGIRRDAAEVIEIINIYLFLIQIFFYAVTQFTYAGIRFQFLELLFEESFC